MKCPNCNHTHFQVLSLDEPFQQCENCGWMVCAQCEGTGAVPAPFSGSDPSCEGCNGEGSFEPELEPGEQIWDPAGSSYTTEKPR